MCPKTNIGNENILPSVFNTYNNSAKNIF